MSVLSSAVQLIDTYTIVVKSNKVMDVVAERLAPQYPAITPEFIRSTVGMSSVSETGVVRVSRFPSSPTTSRVVLLKSIGTSNAAARPVSAFETDKSPNCGFPCAQVRDFQPEAPVAKSVKEVSAYATQTNHRNTHIRKSTRVKRSLETKQRNGYLIKQASQFP